VGSLLIGCVFGSAIAGRITDIYGRKRILFAVALAFALTSAANEIAPSFTTFVIACILGGLSVGATSIVSPIYISEIAPFKIKGRLALIHELTDKVSSV
jgi:MFS family permease